LILKKKNGRAGGVFRPHQKVVPRGGEGEITSGTVSPSTGKAIMLASLGSRHDDYTKLAAVVRGTPRPVRVTTLPFVPKRYKSGTGT